MTTMTWLSRSFLVMLTITLLLAFMTADFTGAHSSKYNDKEATRSRRSVTSPVEGFTTTGQVSETITNTTLKPHSHTVNITESTQPKTSQSFGSINTHSSTIKPSSISTSKVLSGVTSPSSSDVSSNSDVTSDVSQSSHMETHAPTTRPTPSVTNSTSQVFPSSRSVNLSATETPTVTGHTTASVHTSVAGVSGDSEKRMTTDQGPTTTDASSTSAIGLHPRPHPRKTTTAVTKTTSKPSPSLTSKKNDCPLQTAIPGQNQQGLVSNCLIAIASLAGLATFFMVCSIVLCTKLSAAKHRYRLRSCSGEGTEMVCISSLLPDGEGVVVRPKIPKSNGALIPVMDMDGDSDCGDNLTLNSFLPDGDRV